MQHIISPVNSAATNISVYAEIHELVYSDDDKVDLS